MREHLNNVDESVVSTNCPSQNKADSGGIEAGKMAAKIAHVFSRLSAVAISPRNRHDPIEYLVTITEPTPTFFQPFRRLFGHIWMLFCLSFE